MFWPTWKRSQLCLAYMTLYKVTGVEEIFAARLVRSKRILDEISRRVACLAMISFFVEKRYANLSNHNRPLFISDIIGWKEMTRVIVYNSSALNILLTCTLLTVQLTWGISNIVASYPRFQLEWTTSLAKHCDQDLFRGNRGFWRIYGGRHCHCLQCFARLPLDW